MSSPSSQHLDSRQIQALNKIGDALIPGHEEFAEFSAVGCVSDVDRLLDYMPEQDLKDLKMLLTILSYFPRFLIFTLIRFLEISPLIPTAMGGALLRLIRIGLRGLVMSLYYGHPSVLKKLNYQVQVYAEAEAPVKSEKALT